MTEVEFISNHHYKSPDGKDVMGVNRVMDLLEIQRQNHIEALQNATSTIIGRGDAVKILKEYGPQSKP